MLNWIAQVKQHSLTICAMEERLNRVVKKNKEAQTENNNLKKTVQGEGGWITWRWGRGDYLKVREGGLREEGNPRWGRGDYLKVREGGLLEGEGGEIAWRRRSKVREGWLVEEDHPRWGRVDYVMKTVQGEGVLTPKIFFSLTEMCTRGRYSFLETIFHRSP